MIKCLVRSYSVSLARVNDCTFLILHSNNVAMIRHSIKKNVNVCPGILLNNVN